MTLQRDLHSIVFWINKFLLKLNEQKCKVVSYGRNVDKSYTYSINGNNLENLDSYKDLGVCFDTKLKFGLHINDKVKKANSILGIIKRNFMCLSTDAFICLYKSMVRSHLEYAEPVWSPHYQEYIEMIERVQMRATKLLPGLRNKSYSARLKSLNLPTLKFRRLRGDLIEMYKIVHNIYDSNISLNINYAPCTVTRGSSKRIFPQHCKYDLRKHYFLNRVTNLWNGLPESVASAPTINIFKNCLDRFWENQAIVYDWHADISGTGNRSFE